MQDWYSSELLEKAWKYAFLDSKDDFIIDLIDHEDLKLNKASVISNLHDRLRTGQFSPSPLLRIDVPKSEHSVRPGTVINLVDLIVFYALTQYLAPSLDQLMTDSAYAYRLNPKSEKNRQPLFKDRNEPSVSSEDGLPSEEDKIESGEEEAFPYNWFQNWKRFYDLSRAAAQEHQYVAITDITAYFENISLRILQEILHGQLGVHYRNEINRLFSLLEYWNWNSDANILQGIGLPQGNDVSSFLSNIYLIDLDKSMLEIVDQDNKKYFRYVDDIRVFSSDKDQARRALVRLESVLRSLNLNVQSSKTKIVLAHEVDDPEVDEWLNKMNDSEDGQLDAARMFIDEVFNIDELAKWQRAYARSLTVLRKGQDNRAIELALKIFLHNPSQKLLNQNFTYLKHFATKHDYTESIVPRLEDDSFTFSYHRGLICRLAGYGRDQSSELKNYMMNAVVDPNQHWAFRINAAFCLNTFPLIGEDLVTIARVAKNEPNHSVLRSLIVLLWQNGASQFDRVNLQLSLFNGQYQEYLRLYFTQLTVHDEFVSRQIAQVSGVSTSSPEFLKALHKFDLLKANSNRDNRSRLFNILELKIADSEEDETHQNCNRLASRLKGVKELMVTG